MDFPIRKPTRLKNYDYNQAGAYFVTICSKDRKKLFGSVVGGGAFDAPSISLTPSGEIIEQQIQSTSNIPGVCVRAYVIMPNHIHLLIELAPPSGTSKAPSPTNAILPHTIATLKRFVNRAVNENVFQRSFHDRIVRNEREFSKILNYIQTNPAKWQEDCFYVDI